MKHFASETLTPGEAVAGRISNMNNEHCFETAIQDRVQRELAAHTEDDVLARSHALKDRFPHVRHYPSLSRMMQRLDEYFNDAGGQRVLDLGCGNGERSLQLLGAGASVASIDISPVYIQHARQAALAAGHAADKFDFRAMDAHQLEYDAAEFDMVVGNGILHHLDLLVATREIQRVLKPGGRALFMEPLAANPLLRVFRWLTPRARTEDEQPFTCDQLRQFDLDEQWTVESSYCGLITAPVAVATSWLLRPFPDNFLIRAADVVERRFHNANLLNSMNQYVLLNLVRSA